MAPVEAVDDVFAELDRASLYSLAMTALRRQLAEKVRDLALFNLAIDSKLRGCHLVSLRVCDISQRKSIYPRAIVVQRNSSNQPRATLIICKSNEL